MGPYALRTWEFQERRRTIGSELFTPLANPDIQIAYLLLTTRVKPCAKFRILEDKGGNRFFRTAKSCPCKLTTMGRE